MFKVYSKIVWNIFSRFLSLTLLSPVAVVVVIPVFVVVVMAVEWFWLLLLLLLLLSGVHKLQMALPSHVLVPFP